MSCCGLSERRAEIPETCAGVADDDVATAVGLEGASEPETAKRRRTRRVLVKTETAEDTEFQGEMAVIFVSQKASGEA